MGGSKGEGEREGEGGGCCDNHQQLLLLTEDVLIQILLWLPVISLLRFKSVCKSWRSIIESPFFIHLHHHAATILPPFSSSFSYYSMVGGSGSSLLCQGYRNNDYQEEKEKKKVNYFTLSGKEFDVFEDLGISPTWDLCDEEFDVESCCNGIICLHHILSRNVALWNPAIKQSRILPKPSNLLGDPNCFYYGDGDGNSCTCEDFVRFGIDIKTNDHKVLHITTLKITPDEPRSNHLDERRSPSPPPPPPPPPPLHERRVHVYNLSTDSWRCITDDATLSAASHLDSDSDPDDPNLYIKTYDNHGLYLNGSYFFTATYYNKENSWLMLLSFDFTGEIFTTIQPPYDLRNRFPCDGYVYFIPYGGKLALVDAKVDQDHGIEDVYDIWVLNEQQHGVKESWTKLYTIGSPDSEWFDESKCVTNNGEFAIMYGQNLQDPGDQDVPKLKLLNLITRETKPLRCVFEDEILGVLGVYKPSLVPIGGNVAAHDSSSSRISGI